MVLTTMLRNLTETGHPFQIRQMVLFREKVVELGLVDCVMVCSTIPSLPLQRLFLQDKLLRWNTYGMAIQSLYQAIWLAFWTTYAAPALAGLCRLTRIKIPLYPELELDGPGLLHAAFACDIYEDALIRVRYLRNGRLRRALTLKRFYNGHLSETLRRLNDLDTPDKASKRAAVRYPSSRTHLHDVPQSPSQDEPAPNDANAEYVGHLREELALELASPLGNVSYPNNLTFYNYVDFILCPTLCYEIEYPRNPSIRWLEVFYKTLAVFGCIFLMIITAEEFILPVLDVSALRLVNADNATDFALIMVETIGRLLFPFMITFLLVFLVIFEYVLGAFAEITCKLSRPCRMHPYS